MKLFMLFLTAFCCAAFGYDWYHGNLVPAWVALLWCVAVFSNQLAEYLENK